MNLAVRPRKNGFMVAHGCLVERLCAIIRGMWFETPAEIMKCANEEPFDLVKYGLSWLLMIILAVLFPVLT